MPTMSDIFKDGFKRLAEATASPQAGIEGGKKVVKTLKTALGGRDDLNIKESIKFMAENPDALIPGVVSERQIVKALVKSIPDTTVRKEALPIMKQLAKMIPEGTKRRVRSIGRARHTFTGRSKQISRLNRHRHRKGRPEIPVAPNDLGINMTLHVTDKKGTEKLLSEISEEGVRAILSGKIPRNIISQQQQLGILNAYAPQAKLGANDIAILGQLGGPMFDNVRVLGHELTHAGTINPTNQFNLPIKDLVEQRITAFEKHPEQVVPWTVGRDPMEGMAEIVSHKFMKRLAQDNPNLIGKFKVIPGMEEFAADDSFEAILEVMRLK